MPDVQETLGSMGEALDKADLSLEKIAYAAAILVAGIVIIRVLLMLTSQMLKHSKLDSSIKRVLRSTVKFVLGVVLSISVLAYLNVEISSLVALLSVAALAVSLALQNLLSNVAGGMLLLSTKPFAVGDFIEAAGVMGTVAETGVFYTKLKGIDNKVIQIPNSELSQGKVTNYSAEENRRIDLKISASYDAPFEKVKSCILRVVCEHPKTFATPEPMVRVNSFGESAIEYIVRVWCANQDYWDIYFDLLEGIKTAFDRDGIEMTYNHLNVHMMPEKREIPRDSGQN